MPTETESQAIRASVPECVCSTEKSPRARRIPALDFTKGALVLLMVLYHWMNYFTALTWTYYRYLHFLTPSFIFITGFMISNVYLSNYSAADPRLPKRLFTRGLKLMAIFLILNVARSFVVPFLGTGVLVSNPLGVKNLFAIFVSGNLPVVGNKLVAFSILVPISYLLMLSGTLMLSYRSYKYTFHVSCAFFLSFIFVLGLMGSQSLNMEFITIGMLGVLAGFVPIPAINSLMRHPYALAFAYLCYTIAVTIWNVPFPLLIVGVSLSLIVLFLIGASGNARGTIGKEVILLGKYSLLGYISQIAILQILSVGFRHVNLGVAGPGISFFTAIVLTAASVEIVDRGRKETGSVDMLYKAIFA